MPTYQSELKFQGLNARFCHWAVILTLPRDNLPLYRRLGNLPFPVIFHTSPSTIVQPVSDRGSVILSSKSHGPRDLTGFRKEKGRLPLMKFTTELKAHLSLMKTNLRRDLVLFTKQTAFTAIAYRFSCQNCRLFQYKANFICANEIGCLRI